jgi:acetylornithine deacetylase/succinyl-diaminopimelate desuccinylase-like protein
LTGWRHVVDEEHAARSTEQGAIVADPRLIGARPCGETRADDPLVATAAAPVRAFDGTPSYSVSSTDANLPMSLGIPAITVGRGGPGARQHSPDEWTDVEPGSNARHLRFLLALIVSVAQ